MCGVIYTLQRENKINNIKSNINGNDVRRINHIFNEKIHLQDKISLYLDSFLKRKDVPIVSPIKC